MKQAQLVRVLKHFSMQLIVHTMSSLLFDQRLIAGMLSSPIATLTHLLPTKVQGEFLTLQKLRASLVGQLKVCTQLLQS